MKKLKNKSKKPKVSAGKSKDLIENSQSEKISMLIAEIGRLTSKIQGLAKENTELNIKLFQVKNELALLNKITDENSIRDRNGETLLENFSKMRQKFFIENENK